MTRKQVRHEIEAASERIAIREAEIERETAELAATRQGNKAARNDINFLLKIGGRIRRRAAAIAEGLESSAEEAARMLRR